jgi:16S rRNA (uracil1498-N3)-methyltransferase
VTPFSINAHTDPIPMRLPRVHLDHPLEPGTELCLPDGPARHLIQVLRLTTGDHLICFNGDGRDRTARLVSGGRPGVVLAVGAAGEPEAIPALQIYLAIGISRGERMDFAIQKAVELGVAGISPLFTERSMVQLKGERLDRRQGHWQGVLISACEQSGRRRLPTLATARTLEEWLAQTPPGALLLDPRAPQSLTQLAPPGPAMTLLVGPEGGLSPRERDLAARHGVNGIRLGPRILRTETAPLAAIAVIQALWGDFRG